MSNKRIFIIVFILSFLLFGTLFSLSLRNDESIFFSLASMILGSEPSPGDGAFHIPIGWFLMMCFSGMVGLFTGIVLRSLRGIGVVKKVKILLNK